VKKNISLLLFTLIFFFGFCEIFLKLLYPQNLDGWYATRDQAGLNILKPNTVFYHRINNRNIKYTFGEFSNRITNNSSDKEKILILGDSFTFGWLVEDKDIFVNHLQNEFDNYYFVNSSVPGWGTSDYLRFLENYCNRLAPKKILIILNTDDVARSWLSKMYKFKINDLENFDKNYISLGSDKKLNYDSKYHSIPFYKFLVKNSHLFVFLRQIVVDIKNGSFAITKAKKNIKNFNYFNVPSRDLKDYFNEAVVLTKMLFLRMKKVNDKCNSDLTIIYSGWADYNYQLSKNNPTRKFLMEAPTFFKKNDINYYDLTDQMTLVHKNFNDYLIPMDAHPNEKGHKIIAEKIIENIKLN